MSVASRLRYWRRLVSSYAGRGPSQLSFWWERPTVEPEGEPHGPYYMTFEDKASYAGPFDSSGVPLLDYHGAIGRQHNPIAIAQYGLSLHRRFLRTHDTKDRAKFLMQAEWLRDNLRANPKGVPVWMHEFDWEYAQTLKAPWYSGLAQGQGISCLLRAHGATRDAGFLEAAHRAYEAFRLDTEHGGVCRFPGEEAWIEEYLTEPPTSILNGFIWASWGVYDFAIATKDVHANVLWKRSVATLERHLQDYDTGWWSLYDRAPTKIRCLASPFYHQLHIVQLQVMHRLTGRASFREYAERFAGYQMSGWRRRRALAHKALFKVTHY